MGVSKGKCDCKSDTVLMGTVIPLSLIPDFLNSYSTVATIAHTTVNRQIFGPFLFSSVDLETKI